MATLCSPSCNTQIPIYVGIGCTPARRLGGIDSLVFIACDVDTTDLFTDTARLAALVEACKVRKVGPVMGSKPAATLTLKRYNSCGPEIPASGQQTIDITDYNADSTVTAADIVFYNTIRKTPQKYQLGYIDCEGRFFGVAQRFSSQITYQSEDNSETGSSFHQGTISFVGMDTFVPIALTQPIQDILETSTTNACEPTDFVQFIPYFEGNPSNTLTFSAGVGTGAVTAKVERQDCLAGITVEGTPLPVGITAAGPVTIIAGTNEVVLNVTSVTPGTYIVPVVFTGCAQISTVNLQVIVTA